MSVRIHCDACKAALDREAAIVRELEEGQVYYFCSEECAEAAEDLDPEAEGEPAQGAPAQRA